MKIITPALNTHITSPFFTRCINTPLGAMKAIANSDGLCVLEFVDEDALHEQSNRFQSAFKSTPVHGGNPFLDALEKELGLYFRGNLDFFSVPLVLKGTAFQVEVWKKLLEIPYGKTISYGELARAVGVKGGSRAVGRANGDNRLAIVVPCHRVIRSDGSLCGYGGGLWRKKHLLELEQGVRVLSTN